MTKEIRHPNAETSLPLLGAGDLSSFVLRHSFVIREFDLRHFHAGVSLLHAHGSWMLPPANPILFRNFGGKALPAPDLVNIRG
jgi:hypothetical protein